MEKNIMDLSAHRQRHIELEGAYNIRDIGGYPTENGYHTRWKMFLRSDSMHRLTEQSKADLVAYGIRTVIDLRTTLETQTQTNVFIGSSQVSYLHHNVIGDEYLPDEDRVITGLPADSIRASYTTWLDLRQNAILGVLSSLADPTVRPAVYHCAGGKDRTGVITALLLGIAGVPRHIIAEDYALTAHFLLQRNLHEAPPAGQEDITS
ncbi:uncharacterized protein METZ01_LOCUS491302, partial [marine metagenome]